MMRPSLARSLALAAYVLAAVACTWPLAAHLSTHVPGPLSGDTGVYLWNLWSFDHELSAGRLPFSSSTVLTMSPPVDLSLHNYTVAFDLMALPLLPWLPLTAVYNLLLLGALVLNAWVVNVIAWRLTRHHAASWLAGLAFGLSPFVLARATGHLSLVAAAPIGVFWLCLESWRRTGRSWPAGAAGLTLAWALFSDPYYAVYCVLLGALYLAPIAIRRQRREAPLTHATRALDALIVLAAAVVIAIAMTGGGTFVLLGARIGLQSLYTPVLALTIFVLARWALASSWRVAFVPERLGRADVAGLAAMGVTAVTALSPWLYALGRRMADGGTISRPTVWRNGVPGVDLLGFLLPNPSHPLMRPLTESWFSARPGGFAESVASVSWVAVIVIGAAVWRYRVRLPRWWLGTTAIFGVLSLGPFLHVAGVNTFIPGPWAVLRFVPVLASVRNPSRFAVVVSLGLAVLFGVALSRILAGSPRRRAAVLTLVASALVFELGAAPLPLFEARIPGVYQTIADDPRDVSVLHLPFGFRDGTRTIGDYDNARQFYQTFHGKALLGGYLSRVPRAEIRRQRRSRVIRALTLLSEGSPYQTPAAAVLRARGARFVRRAKLGYVVVDRARTPDALLEYARVSFGLEWVGHSDGLDLYRPQPYAGPEGATSLAHWIAHARGVTRK